MAIARRQVSTRPLAGVRRTATETELSAGVGLEQARAGRQSMIARTAAGAAGTAANVLREERRRSYELALEDRREANETALLKASNQLEAWHRQRLYDPQRGALTLKGEAAMPLPEQIAIEHDEIATGIEAGLNDEQKMAFARIRAQSFASVDLEVRRHVFGEIQEVKRTELKAAVALGVDAAIRSAADPGLVGAHLGRVERQLREFLPQLGVGPQAIDAQIAEVRSTVHIGVINNLIETAPRNARAYFGEVEDQIAGDKIDDVRKALDAGSVRAESQAVADRIIAEGGTLKEQLAKMRGLQLEADVRDAVEQRLDVNHARQEREEREGKEDMMRRAYDVVDQTGRVDRIPRTEWVQLDGSTRSALTSYAEQKARGVPVKTDYTRYYALMQQAMTDPDGFSRANLLADRARLADAEFERLAGIQLSFRNEERSIARQDERAAAERARIASEKVIGDFRRNAQVVDDALLRMGINPSANLEKDPTAAAAAANLRQMVDVRVADLQRATGRDATSQDVQQIVDQILATTVQVPGAWTGFLPFTSRPFYDAEKAAITLTIADISAEQRQQIEDALRAARRPVSDATILATYLEALARGHIR